MLHRLRGVHLALGPALVAFGLGGCAGAPVCGPPGATYTQVVKTGESRAYRDKVAQARDNPFGWGAYVVVCGFSAGGHRIRFTRHAFEEAKRGEG